MGRLIEAVVAISIPVGLISLLVFGVRKQLTRRLQRNARWNPGHHVEVDRTSNHRRVVYVQRLEEIEKVGAVATSDPEYEERFFELMAQARERAAALNSES